MFLKENTDMKTEIQEGRTCTLELDPDSAAAIEYGDHLFGKVVGRDVIDSSQGTLDDMYQTQNELPVVVVEGPEGFHWRVPERDITKIVCTDDELC